MRRTIEITKRGGSEKQCLKKSCCTNTNQMYFTLYIFLLQYPYLVRCCSSCVVNHCQRHTIAHADTSNCTAAKCIMMYHVITLLETETTVIRLQFGETLNREKTKKKHTHTSERMRDYSNQVVATIWICSASCAHEIMFHLS